MVNNHNHGSPWISSLLHFLSNKSKSTQSDALSLKGYRLPLFFLRPSNIKWLFYLISSFLSESYAGNWKGYYIYQNI